MKYVKWIVKIVKYLNYYIMTSLSLKNAFVCTLSCLGPISKPTISQFRNFTIMNTRRNVCCEAYHLPIKHCTCISCPADVDRKRKFIIMSPYCTVENATIISSNCVYQQTLVIIQYKQERSTAPVCRF